MLEKTTRFKRIEFFQEMPDKSFDLIEDRSVTVKLKT